MSTGNTFPPVSILPPAVGATLTPVGGVFPAIGVILPAVKRVLPDIGGVFPPVGGVFPPVGGVLPRVRGTFQFILAASVAIAAVMTTSRASAQLLLPVSQNITRQISGCGLPEGLDLTDSQTFTPVQEMSWSLPFSGVHPTGGVCGSAVDITLYAPNLGGNRASIYAVAAGNTFAQAGFGSSATVSVEYRLRFQVAEPCCFILLGDSAWDGADENQGVTRLWASDLSPGVSPCISVTEIVSGSVFDQPGATCTTAQVGSTSRGRLNLRGSLEPGVLYTLEVGSGAAQPTFPGNATDWSSRLGQLVLGTQPPVILIEPSSQTVCEGSEVELRVLANNAAIFQWRRNGVPLDGLTNEFVDEDRLRLRQSTQSDEGVYDCVVYGACGTVTSVPVTLTVLAPGEPGCGTTCDDIDFNNNTVFPEDQDVIEFLNVLSGGDCAVCNDIDFNNNGVFPEDQDVIDFFNVLAGGECP